MQTKAYVIMISLCILFSTQIGSASEMNIETYSPAISRLLGDVKVLRNHQYIQASYGMMLKKGDEIYTGRRGRAYIDFPDNSRVKLGSRARFLVKDWDEKGGVFSSALSIFKGAFRYTAGAIGRFTSRRTTVTTRTAVLGVRGTDFWGRVKHDTTFFLLIEGEVSISPIDGEKVIYNQALHAVNIDKTSVSSPEVLNMNAISPLAAETEINN